jgi:hypothetical protein
VAQDVPQLTRLAKVLTGTSTAPVAAGEGARDPLGSVRHPQGDVRALGDAGPEQAAGDRPRLGPQLGVGPGSRPSKRSATRGPCRSTTSARKRGSVSAWVAGLHRPS